MKARTARRVCQIFFLVLFLWFCVVASPGRDWGELRGWPINWFLDLDPLTGLAALLSTGTVYSGLLWGLAVVLLTLLVGRFFCGWLCPLGAINHLTGWLAQRKLWIKARAERNLSGPAQELKYLILTFLLAAASGRALTRALVAVSWPWLLGSACLFSLAAWAIKGRRAALIWLTGLTLAWAVCSGLLPGEAAWASSLQTGLLDPIPLLTRGLNLAALPLTGLVRAAGPRFYLGAGLIGAVLTAIVLLNLVRPRFYCRYVCPLGALLGLLSKFSLWRIGKTEKTCSNCLACQADCQSAADPVGEMKFHECVLCLNCLEVCPDQVTGYSTNASAAEEKPGVGVSRRGFIAAAGVGLAAPASARLTGLAGPGYNARAVRPPGALPEPDFLNRCIKCGVCARVCPTNVIHPARLEAGWEGVWTPILDFRVGSSGCQFNCIACGQLCPTAAIRPLSYDEKAGRGEFAARGPIRMGTAFVDRNRCLPWSMGRPCIVCQENCPVSPKAIYLSQVLEPIRGGGAVVERIDGQRLIIEPDQARPADLSGGDHQAAFAGSAGTIRVTAGGRNWIEPERIPADLKAGDRLKLLVRLARPMVDPDRCIGCGVCEHECPVSGRRAIRVTAENESRSPGRKLIP